jgi:hypothetical protein
MSRHHAAIHIAAEQSAPRFHCTFDSGEISVSIADGPLVTYVCGTPAEIQAFGDAIWRIAANYTSMGQGVPERIDPAELTAWHRAFPGA